MCLRVCAEAAYPQMDVELVASLRTERHLEETFKGGLARESSQTKLIAAGCVFTAYLMAVC